MNITHIINGNRSQLIVCDCSSFIDFVIALILDMTTLMRMLDYKENQDYQTPSVVS